MYLTLNSNLDVSDAKTVVNWEEIHNFGSPIRIACFSYPILFVKTNEMNIFNVENKMVMSDNICSLKMACSFGQ